MSDSGNGAAPARADSDSLGLTRKEQELLELLEMNPGRCFSRGFLLRKVWGYSEQTRTRTVDVHVSRLRKKLDGKRQVAIHTVVGQGYVLLIHNAEDMETQLPTHTRQAYGDGRLGALAAGGAY